MSRGEIAERSHCVTTEALAPLVRDVVRARRAVGRKSVDALAEAAEALGLSRRTVRAVHQGESVRGRGIDLPAVQARYAAHLDARVRELETSLHALRCRQAAVRERLERMG
jgi:hypothetical protein